MYRGPNQLQVAVSRYRKKCKDVVLKAHLFAAGQTRSIVEEEVVPAHKQPVPGEFSISRPFPSIPNLAKGRFFNIATD
jgi:hypothetical protein